MRRMVLFVLLIRSTICVQYSQKFFKNIINNLEEPITPKCRQQFVKFITNLNETSWALQMVDSNSKIPKGLVRLQFEDLGDFDQCISINSGDIFGKYCLGYVSIDNDSSILASDTISYTAPVWALCLPNGCTTNDTQIIGNALLSNLLEDDGISINFPDFLCQTKEDTQAELTVPAIVAITILSSIVLIVVSSTLYDIYCAHTSLTCPELIKPFSIYNNSSILTLKKPKPDHLPFLDGLKFISMMWVLILHQYTVPMDGNVTNTKYLKQWPAQLHSMFILSGDVSVDTFLTIGGTLMAYGFMQNRHKNISFNLLQYYLHRYLRLTASLAVVVLVSASLLIYMGSGPKWPIFVLSFQNNCEVNWWSTLLYVQNYVNPAKMCVAQTWYLNVDMQLCLISPLIFYALWKYPKSGLVLLTLISLSLMGASFYEVWNHHLPGKAFRLYSKISTDFLKYYYGVTHTRATPWIFGSCVGYFVFKIKHKQIDLRLNKYIIVCLWILCFGVLLSCVFGGHDLFLRQQYDQYPTIINAVYAALVRPAWSIAISWIILACSRNYGGPINWILSLPIYQVLNMFTYSLYLTHMTMLHGIAFSKRWVEFFSEFDRAYQFWGTLGFNAVLAILLVFFVECPALGIEKMISENVDHNKKQTKNSDKGVENIGFDRCKEV